MRFLALLLSLALLQGPSALPPTRAQFLTLFGSYMDALRIQAGIPGLSAAIVGDTDVLWQQAFGQQDLEDGLATRTDTPFHVDGLTQLFSATLVLRCIEEGRLTPDSPMSSFSPKSPWAAATVGQILTHTAGTPGHATFNYNPAWLDAMKFVIETCTATRFRVAMRTLLNRLAMTDSVPGPDAAEPTLPTLELATATQADRYAHVLSRLATPYAISTQGVASRSRHPVTTLGAAGGLISTVLDFAKFDLALKRGVLLRRDTLAAAWQAPLDANGQSLPHGLGWFVQTYHGEPVVWQLGVAANASSSLIVTLPARNLTLMLFANSDGLGMPPSLTAGDVTVSPFARVFLGLVVK